MRDSAVLRSPADEEAGEWESMTVILPLGGGGGVWLRAEDDVVMCTVEEEE